MTIAITGSTGFVGSALARFFFRQGHNVLTFGRKTQPTTPEHAQYAQWDIARGSVEIAEPIDVIVHCAGAVSDWGTYEYMYQTNVLGTKHVLESFANTRQFIYISTASVYDSYKNHYQVTENEPYAEKYPSFYGLTKMMAEKEVLDSHIQSKVILRPHAVYGPNDTTLTPRILAARRGGKLLAVGNGANRLSVTYIGNLLLAVELAIKKEVTGEIFNIADDLEGSLDNILKALLSASLLPEDIYYIDRRIALGHAYAAQSLFRLLRSEKRPLLTPYIVYELTKDGTLDISKAKRLLGYAPTVTYREGFMKALQDEN